MPQKNPANPNPTLIFDCETIPDIELIKQAFSEDLSAKGINLNGDFLSIANAAQELHKERTNSSFLPICFHRVVSIGAVICDEFGRFKSVGNFAQNNKQKTFLSANKISNDTDKNAALAQNLDFQNEREYEILSEFWRFFNKKRPRLISFNGRGFDMPMLLLRALKHGINAAQYLECENKWENYRRGGEDYHSDLMELLGARGGLKLDWAANLAGFPGKFDTHGDQVLDLYCRGEFNKIDEYCQSDVLNTYGIWLAYEMTAGRLLELDLCEILEGFLKKLPQDKSWSEIFSNAITNKIESITNSANIKSNSISNNTISNLAKEEFDPQDQKEKLQELLNSGAIKNGANNLKSKNENKNKNNENEANNTQELQDLKEQALPEIDITKE